MWELFPQPAETTRLTQWLDGHGLPVEVPVPAADGRLQIEVDDTSTSLQRMIDADLLDTTDPHQVRAAGAVPARLQDPLTACPKADRVAALQDPSVPLRARITGWLDSSADHLPATAHDTPRRLLADVPAEPLPTQLVHRDFRSANVLCAGAEVAAVIDFEETAFDHRVVELARSAVVLGTRFRDWDPLPRPGPGPGGGSRRLPGR